MFPLLWVLAFDINFTIHIYGYILQLLTQWHKTQHHRQKKIKGAGMGDAREAEDRFKVAALFTHAG